MLLCHLRVPMSYQAYPYSLNIRMMTTRRVRVTNIHGAK